MAHTADRECFQGCRCKRAGATMAVASAGTVARRCCVTTSQKRTVPSLPSEASMPGLPGTADRLTTAPGCPAAALRSDSSCP